MVHAVWRIDDRLDLDCPGRIYVILDHDPSLTSSLDGVPLLLDLTPLVNRTVLLSK